MSRPTKPMPSEPLGAFLTREFIAFAKSWPNKKDFGISGLDISFAPNGYPITGRADMLSILFRLALPEEFQPDAEEARLFMLYYRSAPDFVLKLVIHVREKIQNASPHRRHILFSSDHHISPKAIKARLREATDLGTVKAERRKLRKIADKVSVEKKEADEYYHNKLTENLNKPAPWRPKSGRLLYRIVDAKTAEVKAHG
jgi:hypothetical protein